MPSHFRTSTVDVVSMSENGEQDRRADLSSGGRSREWHDARRRQQERAMTRSITEHEALRLQDDGLSRRQAHAGRDRRRPRRDPVGERPPGPRAAEHRGRGRPAIPCCVETERQLEEYFAGRRTDVHGEAGSRRDRLSAQGVERAADDPVRRDAILRTDRAGRSAIPTAVRAVGAANGRNPVSIVAPCHRVIGSTGKLTGFAGGLEAKARLLALEGAGGCPACDRQN